MENETKWLERDNIDGLSDEALGELFTSWITIDEDIWEDYLQMNTKDFEAVILRLLKAGLLRIPYTDAYDSDNLSEKDKELINERFEN